MATNYDKLLTSNKQFFEQAISKNASINQNKEYNSTHPDALSDGDEFGKGLNNNQVGGATDVKQHILQTAKNKYNANNEYGNSNI